MAINRIVTGQTFGNWLDTTNQIIDDLNSANANKNPGKLVRYNNTGSLTIHDVTANSIILANGTRIDRINTDYTTFEDDNSILTANAVYSAIRAENKTTIKDTPGDAAANSRVTVDPNSLDIELVVDHDLKMLVSNTVTTFKNNVVMEGDLYVQGNTVEFTTETLQIEDNNIVLNQNGNYVTAENAGFDVQATNAHIRLVSTGNRFPVYYANDNNNDVYLDVDVDLNTTWKLFRIGTVDRKRINMNEKDRLKLSFDIIPGTPMTNTVPIAIGTTVGPSREANVLEPSTGLVEYAIGGVTYPTYADYKSAFVNTAIATTATVSFDPDAHGLYYYWAGNIINDSYNEEVLIQTIANGKILIDYPSGIPTEENPTIELDNGDTFKFSIDLTKVGHDDYYFALSTKPFSDSNRTAISNILFDVADVTYEIDGQIYDSVNSKSFSDYTNDFTSNTKNFANVTFNPNGQIGTYYYWMSSNNQVYDMGGEIQVSANNMSMGGEIEVGLPFGIDIPLTVSVSGTTVSLDTAANYNVPMDAGDTLILQIATTGNSPIVISSNGTLATALEYANGVRYELDGVKVADSAAYIAGFAGATNANIVFIPSTSGTYYYHVSSDNNTNAAITVAPARDKRLDAFSFKTDNHFAIFENENEFKFTKRHNSLLEMDGVFADFSGTKSGIVLPSESVDYTPAQNGIIRYNPLLNMFEGFTSGQWRGLGGVVDLNQDTHVEADDTNDTLYFTTNGTLVSELKEDEYYLNTLKTSGADSGDIKIKSNINLAEYSVYSTQVISGVTKTSGIVLDGEGIDLDSVGYLTLPYGTTAERPVNPTNGMVRVNSQGLRVWDATTNTSQIEDAIEMWDGTQWQNLTTVVNEYTVNVTAPSGTNTITVTSLLYAFDKSEIDVYVDGVRILKGDYTLSSVPNGNYFDSTLTFTSIRKKDQIITIVHQPGRKVGITTVDAVTRSELLNGFSSDVFFSGVTTLGSGQISNSKDTGALVVLGGVGISHDLFVGKSITELSAGALKTNIMPIESALEKVNKLNGVEFNWIDRENGDKEYGLIAEEVAKITPNLVSYDNQKPQGVKYSKVVALLIEAIKQQQGEINELKSKVTTKRTRKPKVQ